MNNERPMNSWLTGLACSLLLLPILGLLGWHPRYGWIVLLAHGVEGADVPSLVLFGLAGVVLAVRRAGGLPAAGMLLCLTFVGQMVSREWGPRPPMKLRIGSMPGVPGIDVYCNGVHLGQTPVVVNDLRSRVPAAETPPDQPHVDFWSRGQNDLRYARWSWVPQNFYELGTSGQHDRFGSGGLPGLMRGFEMTPHWWRFEKDGRLGVCGINNFTPGASYYPGANSYHVHPAVAFPSVPLQLQALLAVLDDSGGQPDQAWIDHVHKHLPLLFASLAEASHRDERLRPILTQLVFKEFDLPPNPSREQIAAAVDRIVERCARHQSFTVPSIESEAILRVGRVDSQPIIDRMGELLNDAVYWIGSGGYGDGTSWTTSRAINAGRLPLEFAMVNLRLQPPELFDRLVYCNRRGQFLELIAQYENQTAIDIVSSRIYYDASRMYRSPAIIKHFYNPQLEPAVRWLADGDERQFGDAVRQYVENRIRLGTMDEGLARWFAIEAHLERQAIAPLLVQIQLPSLRDLVAEVTDRDQEMRNLVLDQLRATPNPLLEDFVIASCREHIGRSSHSDSYFPSFRALSSYDTPAVRALVREIIANGGQAWNELAAHVMHPQWDWLVDELVSEPTVAAGSERPLVVMLARLDTDRAWDRIAELDADDRFHEFTAPLLKRREVELQQRAKRLQQGLDLIAGRIQPDDLLELAPYVWKNGRYVAASGGF